jgi:hypothetical protein
VVTVSDSDALVQLAESYVALSRQMAEVRRKMAEVIGNGHAGDANPFAEVIRPPRRAQSTGRPAAPRADKAAAPTPRARIIEESAVRDEAVLAAIRAQPGLTHARLVEATGQRHTTLSVRLARLREKGLIERGEDGAWTSSQP